MTHSFKLMMTLGVALAGCTTTTDEAEPALEEEEQELFGLFGAPRAVYVMDNAVARNAVVQFRRTWDGSLVRGGTFPTGGFGTGAGLGSQGALVLTPDGRRLFAVNAGSDEVSWFDIHGGYLVLRDVVASGGANPISLTVHDDVVYVVNAGRGSTAANISGFRLDGTLSPIAGSMQPLSAAAPAPAQIEFSPDGQFLIVTEKATNNLVTYAVDSAGRAGAPVVTASHGQTPFGFAFDKRGTLIVSEAFGGAPNASALSSYRLSPQGVPQLVSGSVATGQTAACWVAIGDRYAYTTNTGSDSVSGYSVGAGGSLTRFSDGGVTAATGDGPIDLDFTSDGRFLYVLDAASDSIDIVQARYDGTLQVRGQVTGLAASAVGIAAH